MKKKIVSRILPGFLSGVSIGYFISIIFSMIFAKGYYSPCVPSFVDSLGNEITAVLLQTLLTGVLGVTFSVSQLIWELEHWSLFRQSATYLLITSIVMLPTAFILQWMEHSLIGFLSYASIFVFIFLFIWLIQYNIYKHQILQINERIQAKK